MCGVSHKREDAAAAIQQSLVSSMISQASTVFSNSDKIFNQLVKGASKLYNSGPSQHGASAEQLNAQNAQIVTQGANAARFADAAAKSGQAAMGGGNEVSGSGVPVRQNQNVALQTAGQVASAENLVTQQDWSMGRENWKTAGAILGAAPGVYDVASGFNKNALTGSIADVNEARAQDSEHPGAGFHILKGVSGAISGAMGSGGGAGGAGGAGGGGGSMPGGPWGALAGGIKGVADSYTEGPQVGEGMAQDQG